MAIYGISDLHLSLLEPFELSGAAQAEHKPMVVFGEHWRDHVVRLYENWQRTVGADDVVLMPGDLSWAMQLSEAAHDFDFLRQLPGRIVICKGNHDYWWDSLSKLRAALPANVEALQHESVLIGDVVVSAIRGWLCPGAKEFGGDDEKIYRRELLRLEMALKAADRLKSEHEVSEHWVMMHYRPTNDSLEPSGFIELMQAYGVSRCCYGHLHGVPFNNVLTGEAFGIEFDLLSCDYLDFCPKPLR